MATTVAPTAPAPRVLPPVKAQTLDLTANGSFRVQTAKDTSVRCGPHGSPRTIQYTVTIKSRPELVDERGFIIDWRDIFKAVAHHYRFVNVFPSCEAFAGEICAIVAGLLDSRCVSITVDVTIKGLPAHMTASWTAES